MENRQEIKDYYSRVRATDRDKMGNYVLMFLAEHATPEYTVQVPLDRLAYESGLMRDYFLRYLDVFQDSGIITLKFPYDRRLERFEFHQMVLHGPWDNYGSKTSVPFLEYASDSRIPHYEDEIPNWVKETRETGI